MRNYSTFESLAVVFNPDVQPLLLANLDKAYYSNSPTLFLTSETYGRDKALFWIKTQILSLDFYNGTVKDGEMEAIKEMCNLILRGHSALKLSEFLLFIARFKLGHYGKFYGAFDPIALGEALRKFLKERQIEMDKIYRDIQQKEIEKRRFIPPDGYTSLSWYRHLKERAERGDSEAIELLKPPKDRES